MHPQSNSRRMMSKIGAPFAATTPKALNISLGIALHETMEERMVKATKRDRMKLNSYGSLVANLEKVGVEALIRDRNGNWIIRSYRHIHCQYVEAELGEL
ncbi:hypothetical protein PVK06_041182 [Gossypium arboreum]|uniref:Uncharacterized protein n=1 Tax=Gossypium arboreum TaxID=29729 RepID=A0ABR0N7I2_GOSAR|nr:hypothetical protein PVK06_041182 [Gossypium arboreum]